MGILSTPVIAFFYQAPVYVCAIALIPLIIDGTVQGCTRYESNNILRLITGYLFGFGMMMFLIVSGIYAYELGVSFAKR